MVRIFRRHEGGQVLVVVALSLVVLLAAVALALDWGYGLTQRRMMVNAAEAGALAGSKLLATNVIGTPQGPKFTVYEEYVYCVALNAAQANRDYRPGSGSVETTVVEWNTEPMQLDPVTNEPVYTPFAALSTCPGPGTPITTGTVADPQIRYVRVRTTVTYRPFLAFLVGQSTISAAGAGAARLTGASAPQPGPTWPLVRHYDASDFDTTCGVSCNPVNAAPTTFWDSNEDDLSYGNQSKGLVDFSRYSPTVQSDNQNTPSSERDNCGTAATAYCVPQLLESWDQRGQLPTYSGTAGACTPPAPAGQWYTRGNESSSNQNKQCSIPNWAYHLFGGELSLTNDHSGIGWNGVNEFREAPSALSPSRDVCNTTLPIAKPSCSDSDLGDWVEIAASGNLGDGIAAPLRQYIHDLRQRDEWFDRSTPTGNGTYGYYVVIPIYLWDCAEWYDPQALAGDRWNLTMPKNSSDCSDIHDGNDLERGHQVNRVHLFTVVSFTFYEGLVDGSKISGFWGGKIGDSLSCQADPPPAECELNGISNGVYLVPPD